MCNKEVRERAFTIEKEKKCEKQEETRKFQCLEDKMIKLVNSLSCIFYWLSEC